MRRRWVTFAISLATLTPALLGAAWAATGYLPLVTATAPGAPRVVAADATRPLVANDREGVAVLSAGAMAPGEVRAGEVTIGNAGDGVGDFTLTSTGATGSPLLAEALDLSVLDVTGGDPETLFSGALAGLDRVQLGRFATGATRRYRFELRFAPGRSAERDDPLQGASTAVTFTWVAVASGEDAGTMPLPVESAPSSGSSAVDRGPDPVTAAVVPDPAVLRLRLTRAPGAIRGGALVTRLSSTMPASALLTGTITVAGRRMPLRAMRVRVAETPRMVRVRVPRRALVHGAGRRATIRLSLTAAAGSRRTSMRRTLRITLPRRASR